MYSVLFCLLSQIPIDFTPITKPLEEYSGCDSPKQILLVAASAEQYSRLIHLIDAGGEFPGGFHGFKREWVPYNRNYIYLAYFPGRKKDAPEVEISKITKSIKSKKGDFGNFDRVKLQVHITTKPKRRNESSPCYFFKIERSAISTNPMSFNITAVVNGESFESLFITEKDRWKQP